MKASISRWLKVVLGALRLLIGLHDAAHKNKSVEGKECSSLNQSKQ